MQQLIEQLTSQYGVSAGQAQDIINTVQTYLQNTQPAAGEKPAEENILQKATHFVEDHIPGNLKEKAEEALEGVGGKLKGLFS
jgi:hypothetical protein